MLANKSYHFVNLSFGKHLLIIVLVVLAVSYFTPNKESGEFLNLKITIKTHSKYLAETRKKQHTKITPKN